MILQCPRCRAIKQWDRAEQPEGPGECPCGAYSPWNVLKQMPSSKGFVRVISDKGWQELHGPRYREDPDGWKTTPMSGPYTREELATADPGFPQRGPVCKRCRTHVPQFADLTPIDEAAVLALIDLHGPVQAMHALEGMTGCPPRWAKIWVIHRGKPHV